MVNARDGDRFYELHPLSKGFIASLNALYFTGDREGTEYLEPINKYRCVFDSKPYTGLAHHTIAVNGENATVLVWEDRVDLSEDGLGDAVTQTALAMLAEITKLKNKHGIIVREYCGILTNGIDWILISCINTISGKRFWRHSNIISTVREGTTDIDDKVIRVVRELLAYEFYRANSILKQVKDRIEAIALERSLRVSGDADGVDGGSDGSESYDGIDDGYSSNDEGQCIIEECNYKKDMKSRDNDYVTLNFESKHRHDGGYIPFNPFATAIRTKLFLYQYH